MNSSRALFLALAVALSGCSNDPDPIDTRGGEDSSTDDTTQPDDTATTETDDTSSMPDTVEPDTMVDSAMTETSADASVDSCVRNACGTCTVLTGAPGAACGGCGKYECAADGASVVCNDPGKNACGGCTALAGKPGETCGTCGGKQVCDGTNALKCEGAVPTNPCGGCTALANAPGSACGLCGSGSYICATPETTTCKNVVTTPAPGTVCGTCSTSAYRCSVDNKSTYCEKPIDTNACGGCGLLAAAPNSACGSCGKQVCNAAGSAVTCSDPGLNACGGCGTLAAAPNSACGSCGKQTCNAAKTAVSCVDPGFNACAGCGTLGATPGASCGSCGKQECNGAGTAVSCNDPGLNLCGGCGTLGATPGASCGSCGKQTCNGAGTAVSCNDPGFNLCGGCGTLAATPGASCGSCGKQECNGAGTAVSCNDPGFNGCGTCGTLANPPGTLCGICGTYTCVGGGTTCTDTAKLGGDFAYAGGTLVRSSPSLGSTNSKYAFTYPLQRRGSIVSVDLRILRSNYMATTSTVTMEIFTGEPWSATGPIATAVVDGNTIVGELPTVPSGPPGFTRFTFSSPTPSMAAGTPIVIQITRTGPDGYTVWGSASGGPAILNSYYFNTAWNAMGTFDPAILVDMNGCF